MKNTLILDVVDLDANLAATLVAKVQAATRGVRLTANGYFRRGKKHDDWPDTDWRRYYRQFARKLFPHGWVHTGGHHLAVHASPPTPGKTWREPGGEAGRCLFRIIEATPATATQKETKPNNNPQPKANQTMQC